MRLLLVPYAIDIERGVKISAEEIGCLMEDPSSTLRLQATARLDTASRKALQYICPACGSQLYPHAPRFGGGRYYWSHLPRGAFDCPLERKRKLTPDEINARIFYGRQEGEAHKKLVALLTRLARADPTVGEVSVGQYEPPPPALKAEIPHGRFPDVQFLCNGRKVVLEAQLATITLHGINGRRAFYDRLGTSLLWVMQNFDPTGPMRASVRDIVADQGGQLFSIDADLVAQSETDGVFRLRAWTHKTDGRTEPWEASVLTISEASELVRPIRWCDDFKMRWVSFYRGGYYVDPLAPDPYVMLDEVAAKAGLPPFGERREVGCLLSLVRLLISLEAGVVTGSAHPTLISLANGFGSNGGHRAMTLVCKAIELWQPALMLRPSMQQALVNARQRLAEEGLPEWGRLSSIGRIREALFPDWVLAEPPGAR